MPGRIPDSVIQQIRERVNLVELVGQQVKLRRTGRNWVGLCPFHSDGKPSFSVNPERGFFYCFGCHEGGDAISFLTKLKGMSYPEAVESLAHMVGVEVTYEDGVDPTQRARSRERRQQLADVLREAHAWFRTRLTAPEGREGSEYVGSRGVGQAMISAFQIGFCPSGDGLYQHFTRRGLPLNLAEELGLIGRSRSGGHRDRFGGRVTFPVLTMTEQVAGFSGRALPGGLDPKYLNSPDSEVFKKGELLFGLVQARDAVKKQDQAILVEGQLDVVSLHQAGFTRAVAPLGTALTEHQAMLLKRLSSNVCLMYDGDEAGRKATWRSMSLLMNQGLYGTVVRLADKEDPDSMARKEGGAQQLAALIENARPFLEHALEVLASGAGRSLHGRVEAARRGMEFASQIQSVLDRQVFTEQLADRLGLEPAALKAEAVASAAQSQSQEGASAQEIPRKEIDLLELAVQFPELIPRICRDESFEQVENESVRGFLLALFDQFEEEGRYDVQAALQAVEHQGLRDVCGRVLMEDRRLAPADAERGVREVMSNLKRSRIEMRIDEVSRRIRVAESSGDSNTVLELLREQEGLGRELASLSARRN
ncbi:MAG: DNA primase [Deltaproteobacteria bacterium]|nr:DNA primase [Deltaproteobacteria bacterium]